MEGSIEQQLEAVTNHRDQLKTELDALNPKHNALQAEHARLLAANADLVRLTETLREEVRTADEIAESRWHDRVNQALARDSESFTVIQQLSAGALALINRRTGANAIASGA